ncbi:hypothetical protein GWK47_012075 [Chionoecetes opilio]|uniref:Uncharacterized protein n=1 Tax=Chionoecetes opilio TaxID=41210 RepID=A0A8J4Y1I7_CHIOP|nr:hypothetical protein GWK47_012075 [Chionoecetes opilio]
MVEGGRQTHFPLAAFQFLPAFLTTALRRAASTAHQPLYSLTWTFHLTNLPSQPLPDLPIVLSPDPASNPPHEPASPSPEAPDDSREHQSDPPAVPTPDMPITRNTSQDSQSEVPASEDPVREGEVEEEGQGHSPTEEEHVWGCWGQDGTMGLLASGLWLVGASWNAERYELQEASLQSLVEQLPLLSMAPVVVSSSTPPMAHIPEVAPSECDMPASLGDGSGSLPRSFEESGCPSLDTLLEDTEAADTNGLEIETGQYLCPVYQGGPSSIPGPPVLTVPLPAGPHGPDYWVQRRVAMYLSQH